MSTQITFFDYSKPYYPLVTTPNGGGYGNINNEYRNCIIIKTAESTTVTVEYLEWFEGFDRTQEYPAKVQTWTDSGKSSTTHVFMLKSVFKDKPSFYIFRYSIQDGSGTETKQKFTADEGAVVKWSGGQFAVYDPDEKSYTEINNVKLKY